MRPSRLVPARLLACALAVLLAAAPALASSLPPAIKVPGATSAETVAKRFGRTAWVQDWGAKCDGATDDTAAIAAALSANSVGGTKPFKLLFPAGTCVADQIVVPRLAILSCPAGPQACILKQRAGANRDFITSENFASLVDTGLSYGPAGTFNGTVSSPLVPSWFGLEDLHIDGNASAQTAGTGRGIAFYGNAQLLLGHVLIENTRGDCLFTEASYGYAYNATDWKAKEEGIFQQIKTRNCGARGWTFHGPHDSYVESFIDALSATWGFYNESATGKYVGTLFINDAHTYAQSDGKGFYFGTRTNAGHLYSDFNSVVIASTAAYSQIGELFQLNCGRLDQDCLTVAGNGNSVDNHLVRQVHPLADGEKGVVITGNGNTIGASTLIGYNTAGPITGYHVRGSNNVVNVNAQGANVGAGVCVDLGGTYNTVTGTTTACKTAVAYTPGGRNTVVLNAFNGGSDTILSGAPAAGDTFILNSNTQQVVQLPGTLAVSGGLVRKVRAVTAATTILSTDHAIAADTTAGAFAVTLPAAFTPGAEYLVLNAACTAATNSVTVSAGAGKTINGAASVAIAAACGALDIEIVSATAAIAR